MHRIAYPSYEPDIYKEHADVTSLSLDAVGKVRDSLQLHTTGKIVPRPVASFIHLKESLPKVSDSPMRQYHQQQGGTGAHISYSSFALDIVRGLLRGWVMQ